METSSIAIHHAAAAAAVLRHVADLVDEGGLPVPLGITVYGSPTVQVDAEDLPAWLTALEVVEPTWVADSTAIHSGYEHARWEPDAFDGHPFAVSSCRFVVAEVCS